MPARPMTAPTSAAITAGVRSKRPISSISDGGVVVGTDRACPPGVMPACVRLVIFFSSGPPRREAGVGDDSIGHLPPEAQPRCCCALAENRSPVSSRWEPPQPGLGEAGNAAAGANLRVG